nr:S4 domain-containing protein [Veillonella sp. oral taxon 780]
MRIDKFLAHKAFGTRKEVHDLIKQGLVKVNDSIVKKKTCISILM